MAGIDINRTTIGLPADISAEILAKTQEESAIMRLARQISLPGRGVEIPVITADPTAEWVAETAAKPVSTPGLSKKIMTAYKLAVIVPFSNEFRRDAAALYDALVERLPRSLAYQFDQTVIGAVQAPGANFDQLNGGTPEALDYAGLVAADAAIAAAGGEMNGIALAPAGKATLLGAVDLTGRPLFINTVAEGAVPYILGAKTVISKGVYDSVNGTIGVAGDWTQALYGTVEGVKIDYSEQATIVDAESNTISLWQNNMFAVRAEIEIGFRADTDCFVTFTAAADSE